MVGFNLFSERYVSHVVLERDRRVVVRATSPPVTSHVEDCSTHQRHPLHHVAIYFNTILYLMKKLGGPVVFYNLITGTREGQQVYIHERVTT